MWSDEPPKLFIGAATGQGCADLTSAVRVRPGVRPGVRQSLWPFQPLTREAVIRICLLSLFHLCHGSALGSGVTADAGHLATLTHKSQKSSVACRCSRAFASTFFYLNERAGGSQSVRVCVSVCGGG